MNSKKLMRTGHWHWVNSAKKKGYDQGEHSISGLSFKYCIDTKTREAASALYWGALYSWI